MHHETGTGCSGPLGNGLPTTRQTCPGGPMLPLPLQWNPLRPLPPPRPAQMDTAVVPDVVGDAGEVVHTDPAGDAEGHPRWRQRRQMRTTLSIFLPMPLAIF